MWPGAKVVDHHGMTEVGPVSFGCPARPDVLHVIETAYIAEVVDPLSEPAEVSENTAEPLVVIAVLPVKEPERLSVPAVTLVAPV